jgi:hypothetical protein
MASPFDHSGVKESAMPVQPSEREEEYFARQEMKKRLEQQRQQAASVAEAEKKRLRELHFMHCPKCGTGLEETVMDEVMVDICPVCHGVWLDDGEMAKLTETKSGVLQSLRRLLG